MNATTMLKAVRSDSADDQQLVELVDELTAKVQAGEPCDVSEYAARFPQYAERLRNWMSVMTAMADLGHSLERGGVAADDVDGGGRSPMPGVLGDFRILREIGRGGMGVVYEAEQISLGRRVALKVLPFAAMLDKQQLARFKNEARAAATLDHPNIVAVHSVGAERGVHYYSMQLVEGESLAQVIARLRAERDVKDPPNSLPAPSPRRGGLGRGAAAGTCSDIASPPASSLQSPASFPDTQPIAALSTLPASDSREYFRTVAQLGIQAAEALDFAHKNGILHRDVKPANLMVDDDGKLWVTDFGLARLESDVGMTMTGDLVGTLRYMSPEQALAKRVVVDHRSDIYSLGVTLYELLTLQPAYSASDRQELLKQIAFEEPRAPRQINVRIPRDLETIVLKAIEKNPAQRYATSRELEDDLRSFLAHQPIKAQPPTWADHVVRWARRHPAGVRATLLAGLASAVVLAASVGWVVRDHAAQRLAANTAVTDALDAAARLIEQEKWPEASLAIERAEDVVAGGDGAPWAVATQQLRDDVEMVLRLEEIRFNSAYDIKERWPMYAQAFRDYGVDIEVLELHDAAAQIRSRKIRLHLVLALDNWAGTLSWFNESQWKRLVQIARAADSDIWRNRLRDTLSLEDEARRIALKEMAVSPESQRLAPHSAVLFAQQCDGAGIHDVAIGPLRATQQRHPSNVYVNFWLAYCLSVTDPPQNEEAIRFYSAEVAIRPDAMTYSNLGRLLAIRGSLDEALYCLEEAVRLDPLQSGPRGNLGNVLVLKGRLDDAIASYREAIRFDPKEAVGHSNLGEALQKKGLVDEAVASYREAIRLKPDNAGAYINLGNILFQKGLPDDAVASWKEALRLEPDNVLARTNLAAALASNGDLDEAIVHLREAIRVNPNHAGAHNNLGAALFLQGLNDEAIASFREALRLKPDNADAHRNIGEVLLRMGQLDEGLASYRDAIRTYQQQGNERTASASYDEALELLEKGQAATEVVDRFRAEAAELLGEEDPPVDDNEKTEGGA